MKRSEPIKRSPLKPPTVEQVRAWESKRRKPVPRESAKHRGQRPTRAKVIAHVRARDRTCQAVGLVDHQCSTVLDCHELIPRSAWALGYLEPQNVILVCRKINSWVTNGDPEEARRVGLSVTRTECDRDGRFTALAAAADRRSALRR